MKLKMWNFIGYNNKNYTGKPENKTTTTEEQSVKNTAAAQMSTE
jgi:hypothetical protein